jgi:hypothetical protein
VERARQLHREHADLANQVHGGQLTLRAARRRLRPAPEPSVSNDRNISILYADPAWPTPSLTRDPAVEVALNAIRQRKRLIAPGDAGLFLWVMTPWLHVAVSLLQDWGFTYQAALPWIEPAEPGLPVCRHICLVATRGVLALTTPWPDGAVITMSAEPGDKPPVIFELVETLFPTGDRVDLFPRDAVRPGWTAVTTNDERAVRAERSQTNDEEDSNGSDTDRRSGPRARRHMAARGRGAV